jgi:hypothetical protein
MAMVWSNPLQYFLSNTVLELNQETQEVSKLKALSFSSDSHQEETLLTDTQDSNWHDKDEDIECIYCTTVSSQNTRRVKIGCSIQNTYDAP